MKYIFLILILLVQKSLSKGELFDCWILEYKDVGLDQCFEVEEHIKEDGQFIKKYQTKCFKDDKGKYRFQDLDLKDLPPTLCATYYSKENEVVLQRLLLI